MDVNFLVAYIGIGLLVGVSFMASAVAVSICGQAVVGAMKKRPESFGTYMILSALTTSQGIYGFVAFILFRPILLQPEISSMQATAILGAGILMAVAGYFANVGQAKICANGIEATASGHSVTAKTMILAAFPETFGLFSLVVAVLISIAI